MGFQIAVGTTLEIQRARAALLMATVVALFAALQVVPFPALEGPSSETRRPDALNSASLAFERNEGQTDDEVRFLVRYQRGTAFFTEEGVVLSMGEAAPGGPDVLRWSFVGADTKSVAGESERSSRTNYVIGDEPSDWKLGVKAYEGINYRSLYPGIDLQYTGAGGTLKSTYRLAAGAEPNRIRWRYRGAKTVTVTPSGDLSVRLSRGTTIQEEAPVAWQNVDGRRSLVNVAFQASSSGVVGFSLGAYDPSLPLVIDPALRYSSYLGGNDIDVPRGVAVDDSGNAYVAGVSNSVDFPQTNRDHHSASGLDDIFLTKVSADGGSIVYSTYFGGNDLDQASGVAVDADGAAYVTGATESEDFPTVAAFQPTKEGHSDLSDAFVTKLGPNGEIVYSTYLGGSHHEGVFPTYGDIAVDSEGSAYVVGASGSGDFPTTDGSQRGGFFVTKFTPDGSDLEYSTFPGGSLGAWALGMDIDDDGSVFVTGQTESSYLPALDGAAQPEYGGGSFDAFVLKVSPVGSVAWSTFVGGSDQDVALDIAIDVEGNVALTGISWSDDLPLASAFQEQKAGSADAFVTKVASDGADFLYSTYLGGDGWDEATGVATDSSGAAYVIGETYSTDFPTRSPIQGFEGGSDAFVTKIDPSGALEVSSYLGGRGYEAWGEIASIDEDDVVISGSPSQDFPTTEGAFQTNHTGGYDGYVARIDLSGESNPEPTDPEPAPTDPEPTGTNPDPEPEPTETTGPVAEISTSLVADVEIIGFKESFRLSGQITAAEGCGDEFDVEIYRRAFDSGIYELAGVATSVDGAWQIEVSSAVSASYIASVVSTGECVVASSDPVDVLVEAKITLEGSAFCDDGTVLRGKVSPKLGGTRIILQSRRDGEWKLDERDRLDTRSRFALKQESCRRDRRIVWPAQTHANEKAVKRLR